MILLRPKCDFGVSCECEVDFGCFLVLQTSLFVVLMMILLISLFLKNIIVRVGIENIIVVL